MRLRVSEDQWFETVRFGDGITLIHEPWVKPFYRCNMWHIRGRSQDLLFDTGLGHFSLRKHIALLADRQVMAVASHSHFDHIGGHHEFSHRAIHAQEADILADPQNQKTLADAYANEDMFDRLPEGWDTRNYRVTPAPATELLAQGDVIDLGDRHFEVVHTPGHSPGGIGLFESASGVFLSGDVIYDGPLIDDAYHSDVPAYLATLDRLRRLKVEVVHGGHFPSFGPVRFRQLIDEYIEGKRRSGCHLNDG